MGMNDLKKYFIGFMIGAALSSEIFYTTGFSDGVAAGSPKYALPTMINGEPEIIIKNFLGDYQFMNAQSDGTFTPGIEITPSQINNLEKKLKKKSLKNKLNA